MKISMDDKTQKYIKSQKEDSITTWLEGCSSWGTSEPQPSVKMGKPADIENYDSHDVDGITVYVKSDVKAKDDSLKIKYSKMLWMEKLVVEGMIF